MWLREPQPPSVVNFERSLSESNYLRFSDLQFFDFLAVAEGHEAPRLYL